MTSVTTTDSNFYQGDSLTLSFGLLPKIDLSSGWTCQILAYQKGKAPIVDKFTSALSDDNYDFIGVITPAESATFPPGKIYIDAILANTGSGLSKRIRQVIPVVDDE